MTGREPVSWIGVDFKVWNLVTKKPSQCRDTVIIPREKTRDTETAPLAHGPLGMGSDVSPWGKIKGDNVEGKREESG